MTKKPFHLHSFTINGIGIKTLLQYNINTNHVTIGTYFSNRKRPTNKESTNYLGINCAEQVLSNVFKNVEKMLYGNPGYDFICGRGYKVDSKACCRSKGKYNSWKFNIKKNKTADYFALLAFDNREDTNPLHFWLIPGNIVNDKTNISISESTISKWDEYKRDVSKIISCCNILKGE